MDYILLLCTAFTGASLFSSFYGNKNWVKRILLSLIYPVISVGGIIIVALFSFLVLKERITKLQWCGIAHGAVATVILSI